MEQVGNAMIEYLQKIFGAKIKLSDYRLPKNTPIYLQEGYAVNKLIWDNSECVVITPLDMAMRLPVLKKHYQMIKDICNLPCALNLEQLTALQRENLISNNIPFISIKQQIYLPFWGSIFLERLKKEAKVPKKMTPTTQLVFLYIFYRLISDERKINSTSISSELCLPKSSVSRAVTELEAYGLLTMYSEGTKKWLNFKSNSNATLTKAIGYMCSPISRIVYLKELEKGLCYKYGGIKALSMMSILSANEREGAIVFNKNEIKKISEKNIISERTFDDFGGVITEVWRYDPGLLTDNEIVDDISLLLCLQDNEEERIQKELDKIRIKYGMR